MLQNQTKRECVFGKDKTGLATTVAGRGGKYTEGSLYSSAFGNYLLKIQPNQQPDQRSLSPPLAHTPQGISDGSRLVIVFISLMTIPHCVTLWFSSLITPIA